ncbi:MAG: hypothetical protein DRJ61_15955 [Acidobacteria bacterium]|nr:MAG: hypothetical protein DRJ61_15955 [Acidobacteriota bacterium]
MRTDETTIEKHKGVDFGNHRPRAVLNKHLALVFFGLIVFQSILFGCKGRGRAETELSRSLVGREISKVVISDHSSLRQLKTITQAEDLASFAKAVRTIEPYVPDHPIFSKCFYVEVYLRDERRIEYEFCIKEKPDTVVYLYFVRKKRFWTSHHGNGKCRQLYEWLSKAGLMEPVPPISLLSSAKARSRGKRGSEIGE